MKQRATLAFLLLTVCAAAGNLLMLAPSAWPYLPGEKPITRIDACILNRIGQMISGTGAVDIRYQGIEPAQIDEWTLASIHAARTASPCARRANGEAQNTPLHP